MTFEPDHVAADKFGFAGRPQEDRRCPKGEMGQGESSEEEIGVEISKARCDYAAGFSPG